MVTYILKLPPTKNWRAMIAVDCVGFDELVGLVKSSQCALLDQSGGCGCVCCRGEKQSKSRKSAAGVMRGTCRRVEAPR